jgi:hypothetical protein
MTNQLIHSIIATGFNRLINFLKVGSEETSVLPLADVLVISRILFAVVMFGFIGYFFDRMKQSVSGMENEAKAHSYNG